MRARSVLPFAVAAALLALIVWLPLFDFDESFYRRLAEGMKASGDWWIPRWDDRPVFEKPPLFIWLVALSSLLIDPAGAPVSAAAARVPSALATLLLVMMLRRAWPRLAFKVSSGGQQAFGLSDLPAEVFLSALLPLAAGAAVLLDPLLCLCLTQALLILTSLWLDAEPSGAPRSPSLGEALLLAAAIGGAIAVKGPIGLILPGLAIAVQLAIETLRDRRAWLLRALRTARNLGPALLFGAALGAAYFGLIASRGELGARFVEQFWWVHNFGRGTTPMQGHRGPLWYHPLVLLLGGSGLTVASIAVKPWRGRWFFPWSFVLAVLGFFSLVATKLPNYSWPAWSALSLGLCLTLVASPERDRPSRAGRWIGRALLGSVSLLALALGAFADPLLGALGEDDPRAEALRVALGPIPLAIPAALIVLGLGFLAQAVLLRSSWTRFLERVAVINLALVMVVAPLLSGFLRSRITGPLERMGTIAAVRAKSEQRPLRTSDLFSPTISSAASQLAVLPKQFGRGDRQAFDPAAPGVVIVPLWDEDSCTRNQYQVVARDVYLSLCAPVGEASH